MAKSKMLKIEDGPEQKTKVVLLYARVSTDRQAELGYSIEIQKERLELYVRSQFGTDNVQSELYVDDGYSGASLERPAIQQLIDRVQQGGVTHVVVYKLDRLSRSQKDTLYLIEDVFLQHNVAFVSMQESFNTATAYGRAIVGFLSVFAQLERENIFERTRSGLRKKVSQGYWPGGGGTPYGYDYDPSQSILVPNDQAPIVRKVFSLYIKGFTFRHIADELHLKYEDSVKRILSRKTYAGYIVYNGEEYTGKHEAIIPLETYELAQAIHKRRTENRGYHTSKSTHLLSGLIFCGECGARMRYMRWGPGHYRLVCYSQIKSSKSYMVKDPNCPAKHYDAENVEQEVLQKLRTMVRAHFSAHPKRYGGSDQPAPGMSEVYEAQLKTLTAKLKRLYSLYADLSEGEEADEQLKETIADTKALIKTVRRNIEKEENAELLERDLGLAREKMASLTESWDTLTEEARHEIAESLIKKNHT